MGLLRAFWRRKWLFIIPFILCFSMAAVAIKIMTPIYFSGGQVRIILNNTETNLLNNPNRRYGSPRRVDRQAQAEMDMLLTSPDFLEKMVHELNLDLALRQDRARKGQPPLGEAEAVAVARDRLKSMLRIEGVGMHLFQIGVRDTDPQRAYRLIDHILGSFLEEYRASQVAFRTSTRDFLEKQLETYREDLVTAEKALTDYQSGIASSTLVDNPVNSRNLSIAEVNLGQMKERRRGSDRSEMARLEQEALTVMNPLPRLNRFQSDPAISGVLREMVDLSLSRATIAQTNREYDHIEQSLARKRIRLNNLVENKVAADYPNLGFLQRNHISQYVYFGLFSNHLNQVSQTLEKWINNFRTFTANQPEQSARVTELQDEVTQAASLVQTLEREIIQQNMNLEASQSEIGFQIKIRQQPEMPVAPIEPNKMKLMVLGLGLSLAIGLGLVILAIFLDRSFTTVEDIERTLGLKVIGTLPVIQDDIFERKRKLKILRWVTIVLGVIAIAAVLFLVVYPRLS